MLVLSSVAVSTYGSRVEVAEQPCGAWFRSKAKFIHVGRESSQQEPIARVLFSLLPLFLGPSTFYPTTTLTTQQRRSSPPSKSQREVAARPDGLDLLADYIRLWIVCPKRKGIAMAAWSASVFLVPQQVAHWSWAVTCLGPCSRPSRCGHVPSIRSTSRRATDGVHDSSGRPARMLTRVTVYQIVPQPLPPCG